MSQEARNTLINIGTRRQGAVAVGNQDVLAELEFLGYIGKGQGLTRKGSIVREQILEEELSW